LRNNNEIFSVGNQSTKNLNLKEQNEDLIDQQQISGSIGVEYQKPQG